MSLAQLLKLCL